MKKEVLPLFEIAPLAEVAEGRDHNEGGRFAATCGTNALLFDFPAGTDSIYRLPCKTLTAEEEAAHSDAGRSRFVNGMLIESG